MTTTNNTLNAWSTARVRPIKTLSANQKEKNERKEKKSIPVKKNTELKNCHSDNLRCGRVLERVPMMVVLGLLIGIQASLFVQRLRLLYPAFRPVGSMRSSVMAMRVFWKVLEKIDIRCPKKPTV